MTDWVPDLPIVGVLDELRAALRDGWAAVVQAEPGAGKTTVVPLALADEPWADGRIIVVEPRRVATRAAAVRMAELRGEPVGRTVGYRMRGESKIGRATRVEVVTDGVFTRMLLDDLLDGVSAVVFDEVHERNLDLDLGLVLTTDLVASGTPVRTIAMSATLDAGPFAALLGGAPVLRAPGRVHPVTIQWAEPGAPTPVARFNADGRALASDVADAIGTALRSTGAGDVLVFLPGLGEMRRVAALLAERVTPAEVDLLHGTMPLAEQRRVLEPRASGTGTRRVVLSSAVAESSLTVPGVRSVVDAGLSRVPRADHRRGLTRLETVAVSRSSADQRAGRAGRLGPGMCLRLWTEAEHQRLASQADPEILQADLADLVLTLAAWGPVPDERWLDPPPDAALAVATALLADLGLLDDSDHLTADGRSALAFGTHPRLARLVLAGAAADRLDDACELAALLAERDLRGGPPSRRPADVEDRLTLLHGGGRDVDRALVDRIRRDARRLADRARALALTAPDDRAAGRSAAGPTRGSAAGPGGLLAHAYPDRIGRRRAGAAGPGEDRRFVLADGTGVVVRGGDPIAGVELLVVAERTPTASGDDLVTLAAEVDRSAVEAALGDRLTTEEVVAWDDRAGDIVARRRVRAGALVLRDDPLPDPPAAAITASLLDGVRQRGLGLLGGVDRVEPWRDRVAFLRRVHGDSWPDVSDDALLATVDDWLAPHLARARRAADLRRVDLGTALTGLLAWPQRADLDRLAPTHIQVPSGSRVRVDYSADPPVLPVRIQEVFGWTETPTVAGGRVPLVLHLLSPAGRPAQVTRDLAGFWGGAYRQVRAELRGRYPKHPWPDDPAHAEPTRSVRRRGG